MNSISPERPSQHKANWRLANKPYPTTASVSKLLQFIVKESIWAEGHQKEVAMYNTAKTKGGKNAKALFSHFYSVCNRRDGV
jgi:hypothetical protein